MNDDNAKSRRLMLISKWKSLSRKSLLRERSLTPEMQPESHTKNVKRSSKTREYLTPIANESTSISGKQPLTVVDTKSLARVCEDKENKLLSSDNFQLNNLKVDTVPTINSVIDDRTINHFETFANLNDDIEGKTHLEVLAADVTLDLSLPFVIGDLVWAYISGYPLWPSLITQDPIEFLYTKTRITGKTEIRLFHVEFFGDNGSRSWLSANVLFPFNGGVEELLKDKNGFLKHILSKSKIFKSLQQAIKSGRKNWQLALDEAKQVMPSPREQRLVLFRKLLQSKEEERIQRKRKSMDDSVDRKPKRRRQSKESLEDHVSLEEQQSVVLAERIQTLSDVSEKLEEIACPDDNLVDVVLPNDANKDVQKKRDKEMRVDVCECCGSREGQTLSCSKCRLVYHPECTKKDLGALSKFETFLCLNCDPSTNSKCCLCQQSEGAMLSCNFKLCGRYYHRNCLKLFHSPSVKQEKTASQFTCPAHYCHTCVADLNELHQAEKKLVRCIYCPTAYHQSEKCLAAGSVQLSNTQMKCFKHVENREVAKKPKKEKKTIIPIHYNVNWCIVCSEGGSLICCERCPSSVHTRCAGLETEPDGSFLCYECTSGKTILYGDIVWVKMSIYRWWPGRVYPLDEIPPKHQKYQPKTGEFLVYFYGSNNSAFVYRGQVFLYQDGDQGCKVKSKNKLGDDFKQALEDVTPVFQMRKQVLAERKAERQAKINVKPPHYNKIRSNKPVGKVRMQDSSPYSSSLCDCEVSEGQPTCGSDTECLNRILLFECDPNVCAGGKLCQNQRFQQRLSPPLYSFNTGGKGWGLKSQADIKKGDFVIEYVGEIIDNSEFRRRLKAKQDAQDEAYYFLTLDNNRMIDAGPSGNLARFMNHSCQPNCETQKWTVLGDTRIGLFAMVDIPAHAELTFNYQLECAQDVANESNQRQQPCHCGAPNCAGFIGAKPKQLKVEKIKSIKAKKKKQQRKLEKEKVAEDFCFRCTEGGHLVVCDFKNCSKVYHLECLKLSAPPKGQWTCPWHHCDVCGRKSTQFCSVCPNSLCSTHAIEVDMQSHDQLGLICKEHSQEETNFFVKRLLEEDTATVATSPEPSTSLSETSSC
ncbi:histone-lysine N-methyltransferase NSD2 isoform X1 [Daphnia magna]|uniref:Histone-lysine N-methyltransferase NSD3 n=2 Tax=Daphnia magna TaxID=35525 RepID=A0ABR0AJY8_9CRUS|nr:histone-lysine N-methyltransferase NSD2 isoform X1 [Daphnia magna]KAK4025415.1 hypothetical protein OUZ56_014485 [Daphnia magna]